LVLKEYDLWEIVEKVVLVQIDETQKETHEKRNIKSQRMIMDVMKDHLSPLLVEK
jgi:hypothetical protein